MKSKLSAALFLMLCMGMVGKAETIVDFEDVGASLANDSSYRGEDLAGQFTSGPLEFTNNYNPTFDSWNGAAYSNRMSWTLGGASGFEEFQFGNDTVVASPAGGSGAGVEGSATWGVMFGFAPNEARFSMAPGHRLESLYVNNTRTTAHILENGNSVATAFGDGDRFELILNSIQIDVVNGNEVVTVLDSSDPIVLADGTSILRDWSLVDLRGSGIEDAELIGLEFRSTDVGMFGINTPTYVAFDNISLVVVPEPGASILFALSAIGLVARRRGK